MGNEEIVDRSVILKLTQFLESGGEALVGEERCATIAVAEDYWRGYANRYHGLIVRATTGEVLKRLWPNPSSSFF